MHRNKLLNMLENYVSRHPEEEVYKKLIVDFIKNHSNCFERSCSIGHITASGFVLDYNLSSALLMHHTKLNMWLQLGGHCDGDDNVLAVALKEVQEESGIETVSFLSKQIYDIDVHLVPASRKDPAHYHYDIRFLLKVSSPEATISRNNESIDMRWFKNNINILPTKERSVVRLFEKWHYMIRETSFCN